MPPHDTATTKEEQQQLTVKVRETQIEEQPIENRWLEYTVCNDRRGGERERGGEGESYRPSTAGGPLHALHEDVDTPDRREGDGQSLRSADSLIAVLTGSN